MTVYRPTLSELKDNPPDVVVVGAGINGVGIARELALRGISVAVFDQGDLGSGTSSASSKMVHGGLRYLESAQIGLVREACRERARLLNNAPHLVWQRAFLLPIYQTDKRPLWMIRIGLWLYDFLSGAKDWPKHYFLDAEGTVAQEPWLTAKKLLGSAVYCDAQMDDARVCLETALHARALGAKIYTYTPVVSVTKKRQRATGVVVRDPATGETVEIAAKVVVSCVGPWTDEWMTTAGIAPKKPLLKPSKGVHLITKRLTKSDKALLLTAQKDGRVFFVLPFGEFSMIGTTDTPYAKKQSALSVTKADRSYLISQTKHFFSELSFDESDIIAEFAGVRPLLNQSKSSVGAISREHRLLTHFPNFFSVVGGKYTTYRSISESVSKQVCRVLGQRSFKKGLTSNLPLYGGRIPQLDRFIEINYDSDTDWGDLSKEQYGRLIMRYGTAYKDVLVILSESTDYLDLLPGTTVLRGEVIYAIRVEMATTIADFMYRRTHLAWTEDHGAAVLDQIANLFAQELAWSDTERDSALDYFKKESFKEPL